MSADGERLLEQLAAATSTVHDLVAGVGAEQWDAATPCEDMNVLALVEHVGGVYQQFGEVGAGREVDFDARLSFDPSSALAGFDAAAEHMASSWAAPGTTDAVYAMPWGDTPGEALVGFTLIEALAHGWDLARATGQDAGFDDALVLSALALAERFDDPSIRVPGMFGPALPCPPDAPSIDRLAAFLGRTV